MTLPWTAFGVSAFFALLRLPGAIRGANRAMFLALILLSLAMALSIPFFYLPVDALLGGVNVTDVLLRYSLFAVLFILGMKASVAYGAPLAGRLIGGPAGRFVLSAATVSVAVFYALSDLPESSASLAAYWDQDTVHAYGDSARLYQIYVGACLVPSLFGCTTDSRRRSDIRLSAGLLALGLSATVVQSLLNLAVVDADLGAWDLVLPYWVVIVVSLGLALMWNSRRLEKRQPAVGSLTKVIPAR